MARVCQELHPGVQVYAFDTYAGMPETDLAIDAHRQRDFAGVDLGELRRFIDAQRLTNLHLIEGLFEDTAPTALGRVGAIRLAHIDCDIRSAVQYSYEVCKPYMVKGGYIVFDDALYSSCLGATEVVEDVVIRRDGLKLRSRSIRSSCSVSGPDLQCIPWSVLGRADQ